MSHSAPITRDNLIEQLHNKIPDFSINPDWRHGVLGYPIINDLARFVCERAEIKDFEQVRKAVGFLEMGLATGDEYVRDLVSEALETLAGCEYVPTVLVYFGPRLLDLWSTIRQGF
jgi:hypothetical protein